jgi:hypothetical protein
MPVFLISVLVFITLPYAEDSASVRILAFVGIAVLAVIAPAFRALSANETDLVSEEIFNGGEELPSTALKAPTARRVLSVFLPANKIALPIPPALGAWIPPATGP